MTTPQEAARTALARIFKDIRYGGAESFGNAVKDAEDLLTALQADPDAARAVVALLGEEGREERAGNLSTKSGGGSSGSLDAGEDRYPKPAHFDKFTDEQFDAYIEGTGFADRIRAALAESRAPQDDREAEPLSADEVEIIRSQAATGDGVYYLFGARHDILALLATLDAAVSARQEAERVLGEFEDLRAALDAGFEAADHFVRKYGLANTSGEKHATRKAGRDALLRVIEAARATLARTREPAGEGT